MTERAVQPSQKTRLAKSSASRDAALRGASLAFSKPPVKPKPLINTYTGSNGALAAATKVGGGREAPQRSKQSSDWRSEGGRDEQALAYQNTGGSIASTGRFEGSTTTSSRPRMSRLDSTGFLQPPGQVVESARSPSFIAATLAASRSASVSPSHTGRQVHTTDADRRTGVYRYSPSRRSSSRESADHVLDTTPIPPTTSLIGMFEKNTKSADKERPHIRRTATVSARLPPDGERRATPRRTHTPAPSLAPKLQSSIARDKQLSPTLSLNLEPKSFQSMPLPAHELGDSQPKQPARPISVPPKSAVIGSEPITIHHAKKFAAERPEYIDRHSSSNDSFISATTDQTGLSFRATLANKNRHLTSPSAMSLNAAATVDSMANAIVASSLASSRAASPSKQLSVAPPPPPSRRSPHSHAHLFHSSKELSRTPSPSKQATLRTTMRKPKPEEDEDEGDKRRTKKHIMKKHPNKHHEGDRKRWRDEITERERKRYEAVWASNKGLHIYPAFPDSEYCVCNLVVRDIFSRSRLNEDVLEEVYALVDRSQRGALEKEEFVVGMWLIDQRLKGRKLPLRVSDHVWRSVGTLGGIKVRRAGK